MKLSLLQKAMLAVIVILLPVLITFLITYRLNKEHIQETILSNITAIADGYEGQIYQFLERSKGRALDFSSDGFIRDQLVKINQAQKSAVEPLNQHLIKNKMPLDKTIQAIYVISINNRVASSTDPYSIGKYTSVERFLKNGEPGQTIMQSDAGFTGFPELEISAPVTDRITGKLIGIIVNVVQLSELNKIMRGEFAINHQVRWGKKTEEIYLVNENKLMITESVFVKNAILNQIVDTLPVRECLESNKEMTSAYKSYRGKRVIGASMCIPALKWTLMVEVDEYEALRPLTQIRRGAVITGAIVAGLICILFMLYIRKIVMPIKSMSKAAKEIAKGNYSMSVPVQSQDEVGELSRSFNTMAKEIGERTSALQNSEKSLANAQRIAHLGNWDWNIVKNELYWSDEIYRIFGLTPQEFGATYEAFLNSVHPDDREFVKKSVNEALYEKKHYSIDHRIVLPDGAERIVHEQAEVAFDETGMAVQMVGTVHDITEQKKAEMELRKLSTIIEQSINSIFIVDRKGNIEYVNPIFEQITGYSKEELTGKSLQLFASEVMTQNQYAELWKAITAGNTWRGLYKHKKKNGHDYWCDCLISPIKDEKEDISHFLLIQEDITKKKESEERAEYLAHYDELTGLFNRARFMELMDKWMEGALPVGTDFKSVPRKAALFLIDIDEFKSINEIYGHNIGDEFLRHIAGLLKDILDDMNVRYGKAVLEKSPDANGRENMVGYLGGDDFAIFLPDVDARGAMDTAELIGKKIAGLYFAPLMTRFTASIGIALYPEHGATTRELFSRGDIAMYRAKQSGKNRCHLYQPEDHDMDKIRSRLKAKERIQNALKDDCFEPWFQPIFDLKDNKIHHYEALARMRQEDGAILLPGVFIDTAETFGLVGAIDRIITEKTVKIYEQTRGQGHEISFSINLSGKDLGNNELRDFFKTIISKQRIDPGHLIFEITETAAVHDMGKAKTFIHELKSVGCHFCLDDFGVGFTSFVYLRELEVDYIKIDGSFIKNLHRNQNDQLFVKAIVDVAKGMGIKTIAEFVEKEEETVELLKKIGVDYAQGYAMGRPALWGKVERSSRQR